MGIINHFLMLSIIHAVVFLLFVVCPVTSVSNQTEFDDRPYIWSTADLLCTLSGSRLAISKSENFSDISASLPNSQSAWVGGRLIYWGYEWAEYSPKYEYWGCYTNEGVGPLVTDTFSDIEDPQTCFRKCGTQFIGLKSSYCQCLKGPLWEIFHVPDDNCPFVCPASYEESCGGASTYSVYERETFPNIGDVPDNATSLCGFLYNDAAQTSPIFLYDVCDETVTQKKPFLCQNCSPSITTGQPNCVAQRFETLTSWNEADVFCKNQGLTLATSAAENIQDMFPGSGSPESYWVGIASPTDLIWLDGSVVKADFYNPPLIVGDGECLALNKDQDGHVTMTREACNKTKPFLCGPPPDPTTTTVTTTEMTTTDLTTDESTTDMTTDESTTDMTTDESTTDMTTDESTTDMTTDESTTDMTTDESTTDMTTDLTTDEITTDLTTDMTTDEITTDSTTDMTTDEITTDSTTDMTTDEIRTDMTTDEITTDMTTDEITTDMTTNFTTDDITTDMTTDLTTDEITTDETTSETLPTTETTSTSVTATTEEITTSIISETPPTVSSTSEVSSSTDTTTETTPTTQSTTETQSTSESPPTTSESPPTTSENPLTTSENPPTSSKNPPTTSENPPTTSENPPTTSENPPTTSENPPTTSENPPTTSENPPTTSENPPTTTEKPQTTIATPQPATTSTPSTPVTTPTPASTPDRPATETTTVGDGSGDSDTGSSRKRTRDLLPIILSIIAGLLVVVAVAVVCCCWAARRKIWGSDTKSRVTVFSDEDASQVSYPAMKLAPYAQIGMPLGSGRYLGSEISSTYIP